MKNKAKKNKKNIKKLTKTEGVETLLGDYKKAIVKISIPMIVALFATTIYNLIDGIWVSGLGANSLAAVGFVFPFFFIILAVAGGIGIGGGSAISRKIGAGDKKGADNVAVHSIILSLIFAVSFAVPFFIFSNEIFELLGAGPMTSIAASYARIIALGTVLIFFSIVAAAILRSEGDAKRAMVGMGIGAGINMILDPIFIYKEVSFAGYTIKLLGLGVDGAAWATFIGFSIGALLVFYWFLIKKDTYVNLRFKGFKFNKKILKDIFKVGFPASIQQLSMSFLILALNAIIIYVDDINGVAVFTAGFRVMIIAMVPLFGISTAVVAVTGAAYGAKDYLKLKKSFLYSVKIAFIIEGIIAIFTFIFAAFLTRMYPLGEDASLLYGDITRFLRIVAIFYPTVVFGVISASTFQGVGKGYSSLFITLLRTVILIPPMSLLFSIYLNIDLTGVWLGLIIANIIGSFIGFIWINLSIKKHLEKEKNVSL